MGCCSDLAALSVVAIMVGLALFAVVLTIARPFRWPLQ